MGKKTSGSENIRVVIRLRDLLPYESERGDKALVRLDLATNQVVVQHPIGEPDVFAFDAVYNNTFTQRDIFLQEVQPLADAVLQGYNATVFAYGQSGSGKTHTMTGKLSEREAWGMMPQVVDYLFGEIHRMTSSTKTFKVRVSYVELYNGKSRDLLATKQVNLEIRQNMSKNFYVKGAEMPEVTRFEEAIKWFNAGTERRQTASTDLNDTSSRSHSLFSVQIEQFDFENDPNAPIVMMSKINVVDLAGSEKLSKTNATGDTAKEGCNINLSLSALATVIDTIVKGGKHIPYRGSPLTMLLKDSLGGNAKTVMFANIGPSEKNTSETISTLRFALRAKQIENKPIKNVDPKDARIQDLLDQIEELTSRLGNVDLNVEDNLRQRIEELEIENSDLRGGGEKHNIELEEQCLTLQAQLAEQQKLETEHQRELQKEVERATLLDMNLTNVSNHFNDLRLLIIDFIKHICTKPQLEQLKAQVTLSSSMISSGTKPARHGTDDNDSNNNDDESKWDVKEIGVCLHGFTDMYNEWQRTAYTKSDMEKYAKRAVAELQEQTKRDYADLTRTKEDLERQLEEEARKRTADNESISQLKVDLSALRDENAKLREKITRDQEKMKAKLQKTHEETRSLQDQLESTKAAVTEKERDVDRLKRMLEDNGMQASIMFGNSTLLAASAALFGDSSLATTANNKTMLDSAPLNATGLLPDKAAITFPTSSSSSSSANAAAAIANANVPIEVKLAEALKQLANEQELRNKLEGRIRETNVSLRRYGVCISNAPGLPTSKFNNKSSSNNNISNDNNNNGEDAAQVSNNTEAFVLAAADEQEIDDDALEQLQQQIRTKQRLTELQHQHQRRLDDMIRKYELLRTGAITSNTLGDQALLTSSGANLTLNPTVDEATMLQIKELLQRKEDEIEQLHKDKNETCDKLVRKLNKNDRKLKELESLLEEERAQMSEERMETSKEVTALRQTNQQLAIDCETLRGQIEAAKESIERMEREKEREVEFVKEQVNELQNELNTTRKRTAQFEEMQHSYERIQQHLERAQVALAEKEESLENNRQMVKWSNSLLEQEKKKSEELEEALREHELESRRRDEAWRIELAEQMNKQVAANNRRLEAQAIQFQEQIAQEHAKLQSLQKKLKSSKSSAGKAAQRYDEMILENEALLSRFEELKVNMMKMYLEKQEAQRDLEAFRPTSNIRVRGL